jgi:hypothetical protein
MRILSYNQTEFIKDAEKMKLATDFFRTLLFGGQALDSEYGVILCDGFMIDYHLPIPKTTRCI